MLQIQEHIPLGPKTTMKIGGKALFYAELQSKEDCEQAYVFVKERKLPLIVLGAGSNTIFADGTIEALVARLQAEAVHIEGNTITVESGKNLPMLVNELAEKNLDLSPLTGIPGTVGGAIFGNAGQGFGGTWISAYVKEVEAFIGGEWQTFSKDGLHFDYRFSAFKEMGTPIIWKVVLEVPSRSAAEVKADIERLLQKRIETQPHVKTAGSCFLSLSKDTPAWKLIDAAGLRGVKEGTVSVSEKHANFLISEKGASFADAAALVKTIREKVPSDLQVEMRFVQTDGTPLF